MDIKSTSTVTKTTETSTSQSSSSTAKDNTATFKDELEAVKVQEAKESEKNAKASDTAKTQKNAEEDAAKKLSKEQLKNDKDKNTDNLGNKIFSDPINELNSKIATLNAIKNNYNSPQDFDSKIEDKTSDKQDYCRTIKMDNNDIMFFVNLVENRQMIAQNNPAVNPNINNNFTDIKSEATQETVRVSATLMDALNDSLKTNKPFRIDFDKDIAVILRVDKEGVLSANFIPGSAAVENYLKNNIETLRQNFDNQNLPYNELSYKRQQKEEQHQNKHKENENE